jgi:tight adherence protein B
MLLERLLAPPTVYFVALGFGAMLFGLMLAPVLLLRGGPRAQLRARALEIARSGGKQGKGAGAAKGRGKGKGGRLTQGRVRDIAEESGQKKRRQVIRSLIEQAGLSWTVSKFYVVSVTCALVSLLAYLAVDMPIWAAPFAPVAGGLLLPRIYLKGAIKRRQKRFTAQLADAIDIITRGIRTGLPVGECLNIIARESPEPIGGEFRRIVEGQRLGLTLKEIMDKATARMPTADMRFFAVVLVLQQKTGGNLAEALSNLSSILRARKKMGDKIRAMSSEARMTATIIGSLPFILGTLIYFINPGYMAVLFTDPMGRAMSIGGIIWMSIGIFIMKQMVSFKV